MTWIKVFCLQLHGVNVVNVEWGDRLAISLPGPDSVRCMGLCVSRSTSASMCGRKTVRSASPPSEIVRGTHFVDHRRSLRIAVQVAGVRCRGRGSWQTAWSRIVRQPYDNRSRAVRHSGCVRVSGSRGVGQWAREQVQGIVGGCDRLSAPGSHVGYHVTPRSVGITEWRR
jgi:hypothetical protein